MITIEMWEKAGSFEEIAKPGDEVERAVVFVFLNVAQPNVHGADYIQCGDPYGYMENKKTGRLEGVYPTFTREDGKWFYRGNCFMGWDTEPEQ